MSQADYTIADQDGASFLVDINAQLAAIVSNNSGATEPTTMYAYQWWADTSSGLLKIRNAANSAWVTIGTLGSANLGLLALTGGTLTGALNEAQGANIASAATVNLTTATGNYVHITGTTTITAITLAQGAPRTVVFDGALTLTNGASLLLPTGANITTAAGDTAVFRGEATGVVRCVVYHRKDGSALLSSSPSGSITASGYTVSTDKLLGRDTAGTGAIEELAIGTGLSLSGGTLSATSSGITLGTPVASTSGSAVDFGSLPAGIKQITITFSGVSFNSTVSLGVRIGTGGTPQTTGYYSRYGAISSTANTTTGGNSSAGFLFSPLVLAADVYHGQLILTILNSSTNTWACQGILAASGATNVTMSAGSVSLSGTLDIVRIYGGTFDSGEINIAYI